MVSTGLKYIVRVEIRLDILLCLLSRKCKHLCTSCDKNESPQADTPIFSFLQCISDCSKCSAFCMNFSMLMFEIYLKF